ncbi:hypothetical protein Tco_0929979 [Tanacetum coccineum]
MPQDQDENLGKDDEGPKGKVASKCDWFTKPKQPKEPTDPDWNVGKTPQQGPTQSWLMTLASSTDKPSKTFDELMSTHIDFSAYIMNGLKITNLTQEILLGPAFKLLKGTRSNYAELEYDFEELTRVDVLKKHGYGYLREIEVRRANNNLYTFKEGDFLRLRINDIEDMLILIAQNRLINLLGDDVFDFAIARGCLPEAWLQTSLDDITKNIRMEYLPQRIWSTLEKKRSHIMIKAIEKQLKERRMMRSLKKFVGGRH